MRLKNKEGKRFLILFAILIVTACVFCVAILQVQKQKNQEIVNRAIESILDIVQEKYPEVEEGEILHILNQPKLSKTNQVLEKYGIQDEFAIRELEDRENHRTISLVGLIASMGVAFLVYFFCI